MGTVIRLSDHARASTGSGLTTESGQGAPSGHCAENQRITSSYLRAVKVFSSSSKRSKKRQSPAANRPSVAKLTDLAAAYADAHAMRFERSSVSMTGEDSRNIPTTQQNSVGNFRLAVLADKSDKSAMATAAEVRHRIQQALDRAGDSPITLADDWDLERNHIRDFLLGRKESLKAEVLQLLSERYGIPLPMLIIKRQRKKRKAA